MKYSWRAFKSVPESDLKQGPFHLQNVNGVLQPPSNDSLAFPIIAPEFLSADECSQIMEYSKFLEKAEAKVDAGNKADSFRKSEVSWIIPTTETAWLFDHIERAINQANEEYKIELFGFFQGAQVASYGKDGHYNWHSDVGTGSASHRKLSISILLNDPAEYTGGALEFMSSSSVYVPRMQGTAIIFPSFLVHRVAPVTSGIRHSLVSWISGPPYR